MTRYRVESLGPGGETGVSWVAAGTPADAADQVSSTGRFPISVTVGQASRARIGRAELAAAFRNLATLVEAGMPVYRAVGAVADTASRSLAPALAEVGAGLAVGNTLATAMAGTDVVPPDALGLLQAGEKAGRLGSTLTQVADHLERQAELQARLLTALAYPAVLLGTGVISVAVIVGVVIPRFAAVLDGLGQGLPPLAAGVLVAGKWLRVGVLPVAAAGLVAVIVLRTHWSEALGRRLDEWLLGLPLVGPVRHWASAGAVGSALGTALDAGLTVPRALAIAAEATPDRAVRDRLARVEGRIARGAPLTSSLLSEGALPPLACQILAAGEGTGRLGSLALRMGTMALAEADRRLRGGLTLLEPAIILLFGALIALVAGALLQAVYAIRPS